MVFLPKSCQVLLYFSVVVAVAIMSYCGPYTELMRKDTRFRHLTVAEDDTKFPTLTVCKVGFKSLFDNEKLFKKYGDYDNVSSLLNDNILEFDDFHDDTHLVNMLTSKIYWRATESDWRTFYVDPLFVPQCSSIDLNDHVKRGESFLLQSIFSARNSSLPYNAGSMFTLHESGDDFMTGPCFATDRLISNDPVDIGRIQTYTMEMEVSHTSASPYADGVDFTNAQDMSIDFLQVEQDVKNCNANNVLLTTCIHNYLDNLYPNCTNDNLTMNSCSVKDTISRLKWQFNLKTMKRPKLKEVTGCQVPCKRSHYKLTRLGSMDVRVRAGYNLTEKESAIVVHYSPSPMIR